ncbi:MAG: alpha/beta hydrolase, partial [Acidimicrobiia bacterium]
VAASTPPPSSAGVAPGALVVGTSGDPSTPLVSARKLAAELGGASLVIARGSRHTAFASGNACVDAAVVSYLEKPQSARAATRC